MDTACQKLQSIFEHAGDREGIDQDRFDHTKMIFLVHIFISLSYLQQYCAYHGLKINSYRIIIQFRIPLGLIIFRNFLFQSGLDVTQTVVLFEVSDGPITAFDQIISLKYWVRITLGIDVSLTIQNQTKNGQGQSLYDHLRVIGRK